MKKQHRILILLTVLAVVLAGASMLYVRLSEKNMMDNLDSFPRFTVATEPEQTQSAQEEGPRETETAPTDNTRETVGNEVDQAPDFTVYDREGNPVRLSDYAGKPVVLNFWASWCGPCQSEMPTFEEKAKEYAGQVEFLMINCTDGTRETVEIASDFLADKGYTFQVFYDTEGQASVSYQVSSLPTTYFIDANGDVIARGVGALNENNLQRGIDMILPE